MDLVWGRAGPDQLGRAVVPGQLIGVGVRIDWSRAIVDSISVRA
ncbi:hypothetical protein [Dactylosporangium sp. NPDC050588]